jgi:hypothetical protein
MSIDRSAAAARVTAGVDWAKDDHAVCVIGGQGEALERFTVRHDAAGLRQIAARLTARAPRRSESREATGRSSRRCWKPD